MKQDPNEDYHFVEVKNDMPQSFRILGSTNERRKFILDSKNSFFFEVEDSAGSTSIYIGLDPNTVGPDNYIWKADMNEETNLAKVAIKPTDINFHIDTWYYVYMKPDDIIDSFVTVRMSQARTFEFLPHNFDANFNFAHSSFNHEILFEKFQYESSHE